jgi:hypothetical protein
MGAVTRPRVHLDLPGVDPQMIDATDHPWMFADEAPDPSVLVPGAVVVAGEPDWPLLARVIDVTGAGPDRLVVHADVLGVLFPCDLNFEGVDAGVVLAPVPAVGAPKVDEVVFAGTSRAAWSPARVEAIEDDRLHLRLLSARNARIGTGRGMADNA